MPQHVAIIVDGNGRWAQKRFLPRLAGHRVGIEAVKTVVQAAVAQHIPTLSLFAFSTENWQRPEAEVQSLMLLIERNIQQQQEALHQQNIRVQVIGERRNLSPSLRQCIQDLETLTEHNTGMRLLLAINYSGQWAILETVRRLWRRGINLKNVDASMFHAHRPLPDMPLVDLLIRTGGEQRISNFHLWESAYAEFYFSPKLWPDFRREDLIEALEAYKKRHRRYGGLGDLGSS